jgi:hypothetical protein
MDELIYCEPPLEPASLARCGSFLKLPGLAVPPSLWIARFLLSLILFEPRPRLLVAITLPPLFSTSILISICQLFEEKFHLLLTLTKHYVLVLLKK